MAEWCDSHAISCGPTIARSDSPVQNPLKASHAALDETVLVDLLQQLLDLNLELAERIERGESVTAPGIPPDFPNPKSLLIDDCIRPAE